MNTREFRIPWSSLLVVKENPNRASSLWLSSEASLEGVGFLIRTCDPLLALNQYIGVVSAVSLDTPYQLNGDLGYQHTMEFIAILMGRYQINRLGYSNTSVKLSTNVIRR
jgi:hypothetical protein